MLSCATIFAMTVPTQLSDDQRRHLDFIQTAILRMSSSSVSAKGWGMTVAMTAFGFSSTAGLPFISLLGLAAVYFFAALDCRYLREEQLFRELYDHARRGLAEVYSMDRSSYRKSVPWSRIIRSWSVTGFYAPLAIIGLGSLAWSLSQSG